MYKWEVVHKEEHPPSEGIVGTEVTEKMEIPEGTIYKNVILIGVGQLITRVYASQSMVFVPKGGK
jgi:hypothetical protein